MAPPTPLSVATKSINRLLKEESSYRTELVNQQQRVEKLQAGGGTEEVAGNTEFRLRQEKQAIEETKAVFGPLRARIAGAVEKLEALLASRGTAEGPEVDAADDALVRAKGTL
ncbi:MAG: hypothetical protein Q9175_007617 [Cornicularia normoerica]